MVSRRSRAKTTVGTRLNALDNAVQKAQQNSTLGTDEVTSDNLAENSVDRSSIAPNAVGSAEIDRGAVGTENLGVVNKIKSDSNWELNLPGYVKINGASYPLPSVGTYSTLGLDSNGNVILTGGAATPLGSIVQWPAPTAPSNWAICDGSAVSRALYPDLFTVLNPTLGTATISIATPGVVTTSVAHGLTYADTIYFTSTGTLPTGLTQNTKYYVAAIPSSTTLWLSTSLANLNAGIYISTSGTQSGVHTLVRTPYGLGDGSTTFNLPDVRGRVPVGKDTTTDFGALGFSAGEKTHVLTINEMPAHSHNVGMGNDANQGTVGGFFNTDDNPTTKVTGTTGGSAAHNNLQPYVTVNYIIKLKEAAATGGGGSGGVGRFTVSDTPPASPSNGDGWFYSVDGTMFIYYTDVDSGQWVEAGNLVASAEANSVPSGTIVSWVGATAPTNWMLCQGQAISRTLYPTLFNVIGTSYGAGDGTTTFNIPDLRGRKIVGLDGTTEFASMGLTGGVKQHRHVYKYSTLDNGSFAPGGSNAGLGGAGTAQASGAFKYSTGVWAGGAIDHSYTDTAPVGGSTSSRSLSSYATVGDTDVAISSTGTTPVGPGMSPYITLNYIIKLSAAETPGDSLLTTRVSTLEQGPYGMITMGSSTPPNVANSSDQQIVALSSAGPYGLIRGITEASGTLVITKAGRYRVRGGAMWGLNATGIRYCNVRKGGTGATSVLATSSPIPGTTFMYAPNMVDTTVTLVVGDILSLWVVQNSGGVLPLVNSTTTVAGGNSNFLEAQYIGPS